MKNVFNILALLAASMAINVHAQPLSELLADYAWTGRDCSTPAGNLPAPILIDDPEAEAGSARIALRSKVDVDGDGICEIYDVAPQEVSATTGKIYGFPIRLSRYADGRWHVGQPAVAGWVPLVLQNRKTKARAIFALNDGGDAGSSTSMGAQGVGRCEQERLLIVGAYLLLFAPPAELKTDPALSPKWTGTLDYVLSEHLMQGRTDQFYAQFGDCMAPYKGVVDQVRSRLAQSGSAASK